MGLTGLVNSDMHLNFPGSQVNCYGNQIWAKISQNCTDFSSVQEMDNFFGFFGVGEFKYAI